jgi:hypothetical protein
LSELFFFEHEVCDVWEYFALEEFTTMAFERKLLATAATLLLHQKNTFLSYTGTVVMASSLPSARRSHQRFRSIFLQ